MIEKGINIKKNKDKFIFHINIKYLEINDNNQIYKYSLNNYNNNTINASYK